LLFMIMFWCFVAGANAGAQVPEEDFLQSINGGGSGDDFYDAIILPNHCDFSRCAGRDCRLRVVEDTVSRQEMEYMSGKYGRQGTDWEMIGEDGINIYDSGISRYYDDLGVRIVATGKKKVLHFDITAAVLALNRQ